MKTKQVLARMVEKLAERPEWMVDKTSTLAHIYGDLFEQEDGDWMEHKAIPCHLAYTGEGRHASDTRWEFDDGSAIVDIGSGWDVGVHKDWLGDTEVLEMAEETEWDPRIMWPEATSAGNSDAWTRPKAKAA